MNTLFGRRPARSRVVTRRRAPRGAALLCLTAALLAGCVGPEVSPVDPYELSPTVSGDVARGPGTRNVVIIVDCSLSMTEPSTDPGWLRSDASQLCAAMAERGDNIGIVAFSTDVRATVPIAKVTDANVAEIQRTIHSEIRKVAAKYTNCPRALGYAAAMLLANPKGTSCVIFLTDGQNTVGTDEEVRSALEPFVNNQWPVYAIALTEAGQSPLLREITAETGGATFNAPDANKMFEVFQRIGRRIWGYWWSPATKKATLMLGCKRALFLGLRTRRRPAIGGLQWRPKPNAAEKPVDPKRLEKHPPSGLKPSPQFDLWGVDHPPEGIYRAETINKGRVACVMARYPITVDFEKTDAAPDPAYGHKPNIAVRVVVRAENQVPALLRDHARVTATLTWVKTDKVCTSFELKPVTPADKAAITYEGASTVVPWPFGADKTKQSLRCDVVVELKTGDETWHVGNVFRDTVVDPTKVPPELTVLTPTIDFGAVARDDGTGTGTVTLRLKGAEEATVRLTDLLPRGGGDVPFEAGRLVSIDKEGNSKPQFKVTAGQADYPVRLEMKYIRPGASCTLKSKVQVVGARVPVKPSPDITIQLKGAQLIAQPKQLEFGDLLAGDTAPAKLLEVKTNCDTPIKVKVEPVNAAEKKHVKISPAWEFDLSAKRAKNLYVQVVKPEDAWRGKEKQFDLQLTAKEKGLSVKVPVTFRVKDPVVAVKPLHFNLAPFTVKGGSQDVKLAVELKDTGKATLQIVDPPGPDGNAGYAMQGIVWADTGKDRQTVTPRRKQYGVRVTLGASKPGKYKATFKLKALEPGVRLDPQDAKIEFTFEVEEPLRMTVAPRTLDFQRLPPGAAGPALKLTVSTNAKTAVDVRAEVKAVDAADKGFLDAFALAPGKPLRPVAGKPATLDVRVTPKHGWRDKDKAFVVVLSSKLGTVTAPVRFHVTDPTIQVVTTKMDFGQFPAKGGSRSKPLAFKLKDLEQATVRLFAPAGDKPYHIEKIVSATTGTSTFAVTPKGPKHSVQMVLGASKAGRYTESFGVQLVEKNIVLKPKDPKIEVAFEVVEPTAEVKTGTVDFGAFDRKGGEATAEVEIELRHAPSATLKIANVPPQSDDLPYTIDRIVWAQTGTQELAVKPGNTKYKLKLKTSYVRAGRRNTIPFKLTIVGAEVKLKPAAPELKIVFSGKPRN